MKERAISQCLALFFVLLAWFLCRLPTPGEVPLRDSEYSALRCALTPHGNRPQWPPGYSWARQRGVCSLACYWPTAPFPHCDGRNSDLQDWKEHRSSGEVQSLGHGDKVTCWNPRPTSRRQSWAGALRPMKCLLSLRFLYHWCVTHPAPLSLHSRTHMNQD